VTLVHSALVALCEFNLPINVTLSKTELQTGEIDIIRRLRTITPPRKNTFSEAIFGECPVLYSFVFTSPDVCPWQ
jgi:hypothetical protein